MSSSQKQQDFRFKKINISFAALLVLALCFFVSCGDGSNKDNSANNTDSGETVKDGDTSDTGSTDAEPEGTDTEHDGGDSENSDTTPDNGDTQSDDDDSAQDSGDTQPDKDDSDANDNDPNENNDNDNNPSENNDSDYTSDLNSFFDSEMIASKSTLENLTQAQIDDRKRTWHEKAKKRCPYNYIQQPELYDEQGNMYIVDKCEGNIEEPMWLEHIAPKILLDSYGDIPPKQQRVVSMTVDYSNKGSSSNIKIRIFYLMLDVNFVSQNCLSQVNEGTSFIEIWPNSYADYHSESCYIDGEKKTLPIETKTTKQPRSSSNEYESLCKSMPNYQYDENDNACYTTIEEFVWLESVPHKLLPKTKNGLLPAHLFGITYIKRDLDTNMFYMTMQIGQGSTDDMRVYVTLENAKSCIEQCQGKEGCISHIEPSQNASRGCFINGKEVKGEEL